LIRVGKWQDGGRYGKIVTTVALAEQARGRLIMQLLAVTLQFIERESIVSFAVATVLKALVVFVGMLVFSEVGRRAGAARAAHDPESMSKGGGASEAAVFGLLGLLLAFTFSGAASRFEERRHLIVAEANAIGTAYLRVDLLPADAQPELRQLFREYLDARLAYYHDFTDSISTSKAQGEVTRLQGRIWTASVAAAQRPGVATPAPMLLLPALNEMIDITTTRAVSNENHPPAIIFQLLIAFTLACALLAGYSMSGTSSRSWLYTMLVSLTLSFTLYVIFDLEYPRFGFIRIDSADRLLVELRNSLR